MTFDLWYFKMVVHLFSPKVKLISISDFPKFLFGTAEIWQKCGGFYVLKLHKFV